MTKKTQPPTGGNSYLWNALKADLYRDTLKNVRMFKAEHNPLPGFDMGDPKTWAEFRTQQAVEYVAQSGALPERFRGSLPGRFDVPSLNLIKNSNNQPAYQLQYHALVVVLDKAITEAYFAQWANRMLNPKGADRGAVETALAVLYAEGGKRVPRIEWLASPQAIIKTAHDNISTPLNLLEGAPKQVQWNRSIEIVARAFNSRMQALLNDDKRIGSIAQCNITLNTLGRTILFDLVRYLGEDVPDKYLALNVIIVNTGLVVPCTDVVYVCEPPKLIGFDRRQRLHAENRAAIEYADGDGFFYWHGVNVPGYIIRHPEQITVEGIEAEQNAEVRRVMIEQFGAARYMLETGAEMRGQDALGKVWVKEFGRGQLPMVIVGVLNSTPEGKWHDTGETETVDINGVQWTRPVREFIPQLDEDGLPYYKTYYLRVDPNAYGGKTRTSPHAAIASTWRTKDTNELVFKDYRDYRPDFES